MINAYRFVVDEKYHERSDCRHDAKEMKNRPKSSLVESRSVGNRAQTGLGGFI
jgi:hypothetical protein